MLSEQHRSSSQPRSASCQRSQLRAEQCVIAAIVVMRSPQLTACRARLLPSLAAHSMNAAGREQSLHHFTSLYTVYLTRSNTSIHPIPTY